MGTVVKMAGDLFGGDANQQALNAQKNVARQNAVTADRNADWTMQAGESLLGEQGLKNRQRFGALKAKQASSGLDVNSGSAVQVQQSEKELGQLDAMTIQSNAARAAFGYKEQARNFRDQAALDKSQSNETIWGSGLQSLSDLDEGLGKAVLAF